MLFFCRLYIHLKVYQKKYLKRYLKESKKREEGLILYYQTGNYLSQ